MEPSARLREDATLWMWMDESSIFSSSSSAGGQAEGERFFGTCFVVDIVKKVTAQEEQGESGMGGGGGREMRKQQASKQEYINNIESALLIFKSVISIHYLNLNRLNKRKMAPIESH